MQKSTRIIQDCLQILLTQGIRVSMDDIAKELGMSKRTLYEMFENKNELIYRCVSQLIEEDKKKMEYYFSVNSANIIEELFPFYNIDIYNSMKDRHHFFINIKKHYPEIFDKIGINHLERFLSHVGKIINKGMEQGSFRKDINIDIVTAFLFDLMTNQRHDRALFRKHPMAKVFENTVLYYIRGISTPRGQELIDGIINRDYSCFGAMNIEY